MLAEKFGSIEEAVEPSARRLTEMQTGHAGATAAAAAGVEGASPLALDEVLKEAMQGGLENRLETAEDEVAPRCRVDDEGQMMWEQIFGESVAFDASRGGETPDGAVGIGVNQLQEISSKVLVLLLGRVRDLDAFQQRESRGATVGDIWERVPPMDEVSVDVERVKPE